MFGAINPWQRAILATAALLSAVYAGHAFLRGNGYFSASVVATMFTTLAAASRKDGERLFPKLPVRRILIVGTFAAVICAFAAGFTAWRNYENGIAEIAASKAAQEKAERDELAQEVVVHCPVKQDDSQVAVDPKHPLAFMDKYDRAWKDRMDREKRLAERSDPAAGGDKFDAYFKGQAIENRVGEIERANGPRDVARAVRILRSLGDLPDDAEKIVQTSIESLCSHHYQHLLDGPPV